MRGGRGESGEGAREAVARRSKPRSTSGETVKRSPLTAGAQRAGVLVAGWRSRLGSSWKSTDSGAELEVRRLARVGCGDARPGGGRWAPGPARWKGMRHGRRTAGRALFLGPAQPLVRCEACWRGALHHSALRSWAHFSVVTTSENEQKSAALDQEALAEFSVGHSA